MEDIHRKELPRNQIVRNDVIFTSGGKKRGKDNLLDNVGHGTETIQNSPNYSFREKNEIEK